MYGLDAISATNGWSMAIAGALIVMSGLSVLSFVISQLHKIAALLEKGFDKKMGKGLQTVTAQPPPFCYQGTVIQFRRCEEFTSALSGGARGGIRPQSPL